MKTQLTEPKGTFTQTLASCNWEFASEKRVHAFFSHLQLFNILFYTLNAHWTNSVAVIWINFSYAVVSCAFVLE